MKSDGNSGQKRPAHEGGKRPYKAPRLKTYGDIQEITRTSGTSSKKNDTSSPGPDKTA